jgi:uncharacterized protein (TIGR00297 family)
LTASGAVAATFVGTCAFGAFGAAGAGILLAFFVSSVLLSRYGKARKAKLVDVDKQGPRDAAQVLANGGAAALCALVALGGDPRFAIAFCGAFAAATADTWATEIGTLMRRPPVSILTFRKMPTGLSGGVTIAGSVASIVGALWIALAASFAVGTAAIVAIALGGIVGALADSILGASLQSLRWCPACGRACETNPHVCGTATVPARGASWITNDAVNFAATALGAAIAFWLAR